MWEVLKNMPLGWSITILILGIIAIVIVALRGKITAKFGDKEIDIGGGNGQVSSTAETRTILLPPVTGSFQRRTCGDCVLILIGEREKYELQIRKERDRVLKTQMTYAEQKLIEIQTLLMNDWVDSIHGSFKVKTSSVDESIQHKLIYGLLKDALIGIKDEVRRSFKDNGFYDLNSSEFSEYAKDRVRVIESMLVQHLRNIYPDNGGVLSFSGVMGTIDNQHAYIATIINDIYYHAREVKLEVDARVENAKLNFGKWIDNFILK